MNKKKVCCVILCILVILLVSVIGLVLMYSDGEIFNTSLVGNNGSLKLKADSITIEEFENKMNKKDKNNVKEEENINNESSEVIDNIEFSDSSVGEKVDLTKSLVSGEFLSDGIVTDIEKKAMNNNTKYLQKMIDEAKKGQIIKLPAGTFYFSSGGENTRKMENYVIMLRSDISIIGAGTGDGKNGTILKPYAPAGTIKHGLDMFYFNDLKDYGKVNYLENVNFSNFIIDGDNVRGNSYNSSGKGFMINLCRNCHWKNIIVKNTDGTGFGMDNPINCSIIDCVAINCGKNANATSVGASGFGVGTGYSNDESMYIKNCRSIGNKKYGFFFEHQGRFDKLYSATGSQGFVVEDSYASGNLYNYGGERSNDVVYINCKSDNVNDSKGWTKSFVNFSGDSRRMSMINMDFTFNFSDLNDITTEAREAIYWSLENDVISNNSTTLFGKGNNPTRGEAITYLWRLYGRPGVVTLFNTNKIDINSKFSDVSNDASYAAAVKWGDSIGMVKGVGNFMFSPGKHITRAEFVTFLYRLAGSPKVDYVTSFTDVNKTDYYYDAVSWANKNKILMGIRNDYFGANEKCTKEQIAVFLYRYHKAQGLNKNISYYLMNGSISNSNPSSYKVGVDTFVLANPTRYGYTFVGWKGNNNLSSTASLSINKGTVGNLTYYAMYDANKYTIYYDSNGGEGSMEPTKATYDKYVSLNSNQFTRNGYVFAGWSKLRDGVVEYNNSDAVINLTHVNGGKFTLYAIWVKK